MSRLTRSVVGVSIVLLSSELVAAAPPQSGSMSKTNGQPVIQYMAEEGVPSDKAGEKRRDYAVLEAAINDLASPTNPEHKYLTQNVASLKEIVINTKMVEADRFTELTFGLNLPNTNIDGKDERRIPVDVQEDFKRRSKEAPSSLADFKPANPNIIVDDLDRLLAEATGIPYGTTESIRKNYPKAYGYMWAYKPGYSKDGTVAILIFDEPGGLHGAHWVYMLGREGKRWDIQWRHLHFHK